MRKQVLFVEDNEGDVHLVSRALAERQADVDLHIAVNAVQAFSFLAKQGAHSAAPTPDLVILDLNLPIINGIKALNIIKTSPEWNALPVIVLTSSERGDDRNLCLRLGVVSYQVKPKIWDDYLGLADSLKEALASGCVARAARKPAAAS